MRRRLRRWLGLAILVMGTLGIVASVYVVEHPKVDSPRRADAIVVLSGDRGGRLPRALDLIREGIAPVLVVAGLPDLATAKDLCRFSPDFETICLAPVMDTTRTEARAAATLAMDRGWNRLVVVTDTIHIERARLSFERCVQGTVEFVEAQRVTGVETNWRRISHELLAFLHATVISRGC